MLFRAFDPGVRVSAEAVLAVVHGMDQEKEHSRAILANNGIKDLSSGKWYSQQNWLDAFSEISVTYGDPILHRIGTQIVIQSKWPDHIAEVHEALASINIAYHLNHSPGKIGNYTYTRTGDTTGTMVCDTPYPDAFEQGIIEGTLCHYGLCSPDQVSIIIDTKKECRSQGALSTTFLISW